MDSVPSQNYHRYHALLSTEDESNDELHEESKEFYTLVRTHVIYIMTVILLYAISCTLISYFSKQRDDYRLDFEEYRIYRISTWLCAFTLAISMAAFLLLPVSIITTELSWIDDARTKSSLLHGMWSYVFLFSNLSLFVLIPFAWFFTESEGFSGSKRGILSRLRETCVLLFIVAIIVMGLTYTICCLFFGIGCNVSGVRFFTIWQYLPFLYSCISSIGALLLLLCTPLGISHLFTAIHQTDSVQKARNLNLAALILLITLASFSVILVFINTLELIIGYRPLPLSTAFSMTQQELLPPTLGDQENQNLETKSGPIGACLDIVMVIYLLCASMCGLYNLPKLCSLKPSKNNSSFNQIIGNCTILCLLSSALPLLTRTLGMTKFDLLADFGRVRWLGNFYIVLLYNLVFLVSTSLCLMAKKKLLLTIDVFKITVGSNEISFKKKLMDKVTRLKSYRID